MICAVIKGPSYNEARAQITKALDHADLVELRLDFFSEQDRDGLNNLRNAFPIPMIFTLRSIAQGGRYQGSEKMRLEEIQRLVTLKPDYFDLESHIPKPFIDALMTEHPEIKIILSQHNFSHTPVDLLEIYAKMQKQPAFMYKIAVKANSSIDLMHLLCFANNKDGKVNLIAMGEHGQASRILGPILGCPITYACVEEKLQTAPGQLTALKLKDIYRYHRLNPQTQIFGLIGDPVDKSIGHLTHNVLMKELGLNAVYVKINVKESELGEFLQLAKKLPFRGLSVTMPLKEIVVALLDEVDSQASAIGAVNTIYFKDGRTIGYNTDGIGALNAIERVGMVKNKGMVVIGAGGSARAIAYEACRRGACVTVLNRDAAKAERLALQLGCQGMGLDQMDQCFKDGYDILINTIPVTMPIAREHLLPETVVMDIIVNTQEQAFLEHAQKRGCKIIGFHRMFVEQAVGQFAFWYEDRLDRQCCGEILEREALSAIK